MEKLLTSRRKWYLAAVSVCLAVAVCISALPAQEQVAAATQTQYAGKQPKYVFLFIGDGMGMPQINATEIFKGSRESNNPMHKGSLNFTLFPHMGMQTTQAADTFITDSAAAGTALASGHKTNNNYLNMDPTQKVKYRTIAEAVRDKGMKIGIISSVSLDHATPAAFYAHQPHRNLFYAIAQEMLDSRFDYFAGGGLLQPKGKNKDQSDILTAAPAKGYKVVQDRQSILNLTANDGKVIAIKPQLAAEQALQYEIDRKKDLSLADFTRKGIELLDNPDGFFLMVEGGKIDWACHANDAVTAMGDVLSFEQAIEQALEFYAKHPEETLIVVTGDHETGGMSIGFAGTGYTTAYQHLSGQKLSFEEFDKKVRSYREAVGETGAALADWQPILAADYGLDHLNEQEQSQLQQALIASMAPKRSKDPASELLYGGYEPFTIAITHLLNHRAGIGWTTYAHSGVAIPVYAKGQGAELFDGYYDNTDIAKKMALVTGVKL